MKKIQSDVNFVVRYETKKIVEIDLIRKIKLVKIALRALIRELIFTHEHIRIRVLNTNANRYDAIRLFSN